MILPHFLIKNFLFLHDLKCRQITDFFIGWSIWSGGMWNIPDDDGDNIPGVGGNDYPVNGQKELCGLNPTNPGC